MSCSVPGIVKVGSTQKLNSFDDPTVWVKGIIRFMSKNLTPMKFFAQSIMIPQLLLVSDSYCLALEWGKYVQRPLCYKVTWKAV